VFSLLMPVVFAWGSPSFLHRIWGPDGLLFLDRSAGWVPLRGRWLRVFLTVLLLSPVAVIVLWWVLATLVLLGTWSPHF
jgi:hypothetical protein